MTDGHKEIRKRTQGWMEAKARFHRACVAAFLALLCVAGSLLPDAADAQSIDQLTAAYADSLCSSCAEWNERQVPFRIHGNAYYVGTHGLSSILITSSEGHVLIDGALPNSAPLILDNVRTLGFDPADIKLILNSHSHFDHAGGIAAIQHVTGARVAARAQSADDLERGSSGPDDPQYGVLLEYPAVAAVDRFDAGDTLEVGAIRIASQATAGHTPGGTSWSWESCDASGCVNIVYADSQTPVSADGFRYTDNNTYSSAIEDFEHGHEVLESLPCNILITTHPGASSLWERLAGGVEGLIDSTACRRYAAESRQQLEQRMQTETQGD